MTDSPPELPPGGRARRGDSHQHPPTARRNDLEGGREPDYRFTLANERTFLAWIRTSFALLAGGVAVHQFVAPFDLPAARTVIAFACLGLAAVLAVGAYGRWRRVQRAMRHDLPLPATRLSPVLAAGTGILVLVTTAAIVAT